MARPNRTLPRAQESSAEKKRGLYPPRVQRILINLFLIFHILAIACWCLPLDFPPLAACKDLIHPYFVWAGLFQSWDTFAPVPWRSNSYVEARLIYRDGSEKIWAFPRMEQLSPFERYRKERYRKFGEILQLDSFDAIWPDVARRVARLNSTPSHPVKTVFLLQKWSLIVPRAEGADSPQPNTLEPGTPEPQEQHILYGYGVRSEDLQ